MSLRKYFLREFMDDFLEDIAVNRVGTRRLTCLEHSDKINDVFNGDIKVVKRLFYWRE